MHNLIHSPADMKKIWSEIAQTHPIVLLEWELWAGKTTFAKGYAEGLGINSEQVQSPTYTYLNVYDDKLLHLDFYRLEHFDEIVEKGILDQMEQYEYILIEWPKWIEKLWLSDVLHLQINKCWEFEREIVGTSLAFS